MKKISIFLIIFTIIQIQLFARTISITELPKESIEFSQKYFSDYYLYRALENNGNYVLIFKNGLKIYTNSKGEWTTISGSGNEINIDFLEENIKKSIKTNIKEKIVYIQKNKNNYNIKLMNRKNIKIDLNGNIL